MNVLLSCVYMIDSSSDDGPSNTKFNWNPSNSFGDGTCEQPCKVNDVYVIYEGRSESKFTVDMFGVSRFQSFAAVWLNVFARPFVIDVLGQSIGSFSKNRDLFQNHRLETNLRCTTTMKGEDLPILGFLFSTVTRTAHV